MTTTLAAFVLAAALACPVHMLWRQRRGKSPGCLTARVRADDVGERQTRLAEKVAQVRAERD